MRFGEQVRRAAHRRLAAELVERRQFGAAAAALETMGLAPLAPLAQALQRRLDFDFAAGWRELVRATTQQHWVRLPRLPEAIDRLRGELEALAPPGPGAPDAAAALRELYWNAVLCREQGRLVDLLARAFCLIENAATLASARALLPPAHARGREVKQQLAALPRNQPRLASYLEAKQVRVPSGDQLPDIPYLLALLDWGCVSESTVSSTGATRTAERVAQLVRLLERVKTVRNKSISAHELLGVSEEALDIALPQSAEFPAGSAGVVAIMGALLEALDIPLGDEPLAGWASELRRLLDTLPD